MKEKNDLAIVGITCFTILAGMLMFFMLIPQKIDFEATCKITDITYDNTSCWYNNTEPQDYKLITQKTEKGMDMWNTIDYKDCVKPKNIECNFKSNNEINQVALTNIIKNLAR